MIQSYLKIARRNLQRHKMYSLINIGGLAVGMAVAMVIGLWVYDEVSYNRSHGNYEHIGQVYRRNTEPLEQKTFSNSGIAQPVAKVLTEKYGHLFKHVALMWWDADYVLGVGENNFIRKGQFIDKSVIDMFSLKMIRGTAESLDNPQAIIISESTAKSLFGDNDPINQFMKLNATIDVTVTGVYADVAPNSLFGHIEFFGNFEGLKTNYPGIKSNEDNWGNKEIGVRKVVGASLFNIWSLLSKEFIVLVLISFAMAIPVSYHYLNRWLLMYTYHTDINLLVFVYAGVGTMAITLLTVSFHSVRAAAVNPVKSLRSE